VDLERTDVTEERSASIIRVTRIAELGTLHRGITLYITCIDYTHSEEEYIGRWITLKLSLERRNELAGTGLIWLRDTALMNAVMTIWIP
jgi:hypothetical protein